MTSRFGFVANMGGGYIGGADSYKPTVQGNSGLTPLGMASDEPGEHMAVNQGGVQPVEYAEVTPAALAKFQRRGVIGGVRTNSALPALTYLPMPK